VALDHDFARQKEYRANAVITAIGVTTPAFTEKVARWRED
jgi:hypothetical protein